MKTGFNLNFCQQDGTGVCEFVRYEDMKYAIKKLDDTKFKSHEVTFFGEWIGSVISKIDLSFELSHFRPLFIRWKITGSFF